jgi:hypothetical protein
MSPFPALIEHLHIPVGNWNWECNDLVYLHYKTVDICQDKGDVFFYFHSFQNSQKLFSTFDK